MKNRLKSILIHSTIYYTLITLIMYSVGYLVSNGQMIPKLSVMYEILLFSFLIAFINQIFNARISSFAKYLIHFFSIGIIYFILFIVASGYADKGTFILIGVGIYISIYLIVAFTVLIIRTFLYRKKNESTPYKRQF